MVIGYLSGLAARINVFIHRPLVSQRCGEEKLTKLGSIYSTHSARVKTRAQML